jgi:endoglucanase
MTSGSPSYTLDPLYLSFQDSVVTWCEQLHIYLIIDNHSFDPNVDTSPAIGDILTKVWTQLADHYKDKSDYILYEILNEPHGITTAIWGSIQGQAINAIRTKDNRHTIVVGGSGYNTYTELKNLPFYSDSNLLYTFHFYDPFMFTHQGATWVVPSMEPLAGVPFPYDAARMPVCPVSLKGTWVESSLNNYPNDGTVSNVRQLIDNAISFRKSRNANLFCGEFGVFIPNSPGDDRTYWYGIVKQYLVDNDIPWTSWDYKGSFGLFTKGSNELFENNLNIPLLQSLGLNIPPQVPFTIKPDTTGFIIYSDFIGPRIYDQSSGSGQINFYSPDLPNNDRYSLYWSNFSQYNSLAFDFNPDKDLSKLLTTGYAVDLMIRGNLPGIKFDVRFIDTKTQIAGDHPWRMTFTIDGNKVAWDRKWHHLHIPLSSFMETGSWDNNTWYNPSGKFDWTAIDRFEISTEYPVSAGNKLWFDNIIVTDKDTAIVRESEILGIDQPGYQSDLKLKVTPNPMNNASTISYNLSRESLVSVTIFSMTGQKICTLLNGTQTPGPQILIWHGSSENGSPVKSGVYICVLKTNEYSVSEKILKY